MEYIQPLLDFASKHIPEERHKETPLYILATAGMRLLPKDAQETILKNLRTGITSQYAFAFPEANMEIISGRQEGIYQWLAINYVLGKFDHYVDQNSASSTEQADPISKTTHNIEDGAEHIRSETVGILDMVSVL